ncbi:1,2-phenylacetyl-CoA epoxidase subunit PaaC [Streptomonospora litoralis]|uniref:1,2-phenylacetyl-CoA epoxidase, subunit C n=1 Tax=Streptomonospora litoralis TaxID=2498135 RepID=A0A4P6Q5E6_9ACTN|nr:Phenylacetic acid catabolic protein [Streptomonospora litoralis]QBI55905.1 1,2-phenylacetyl-CoA epoxidase, subunit C [Streptomonospora litoralis]
MNERGASAAAADTAATAYVLRLGDDALVAGHRLAETESSGLWRQACGTDAHDAAYEAARIARGLLRLAGSLLGCAGRMEEQLTGVLRTEEDLIRGRGADQYLNVRLVESPNTDLAHTVVRQLLFSTYALELYTALADSADESLGAIARTAVRELPFHRDHAVRWMLRLAAAEEDRRRLDTALGEVWPCTGELFLSDEVSRTAAEAGIGVDPQDLRPAWEAAVGGVLRETRLARPAPVPRVGSMEMCGRAGVHSEPFARTLADIRRDRAPG